MFITMVLEKSLQFCGLSVRALRDIFSADQQCIEVCIFDKCFKTALKVSAYLDQK